MKSKIVGSADYGRFVKRNHKYFGYKLVTVCTLHGLPIVYELVPANSEKRLATETVIDYFSFCDFFGDKGFLGMGIYQSIRLASGISQHYYSFDGHLGNKTANLWDVHN